MKSKWQLLYGYVVKRKRYKNFLTANVIYQSFNEIIVCLIFIMIPTGIPQKMNGMVTPTSVEICIENVINH